MIGPWRWIIVLAWWWGVNLMPFCFSLVENREGSDTEARELEAETGKGT